MHGTLRKEQRFHHFFFRLFFLAALKVASGSLKSRLLPLFANGQSELRWQQETAMDTHSVYLVRKR